MRFERPVGANERLIHRIQICGLPEARFEAPLRR
jgi:hypothetical protein